MTLPRAWGPRPAVLLPNISVLFMIIFPGPCTGSSPPTPRKRRKSRNYLREYRQEYIREGAKYLELSCLSSPMRRPTVGSWTHCFCSDLFSGLKAPEKQNRDKMLIQCNCYLRRDSAVFGSLSKYLWNEIDLLISPSCPFIYSILLIELFLLHW